MEPPRRVSLPYSWKNIPIPPNDVYKKRLVEMVEDVIRRMRWKAFFFLRGENGETQVSEEKYGLKSRKCPPQVNALKAFEEDMLKLIDDLEFKKTNDDFQKTLKADMRRIKKSDAVFVQSDKTRNLYEVDRKQYEKLLHENVTKHYKRAPPDAYKSINAAAKGIAEALKVADRIDALSRREAFVTLKDHKENFESKLPCRLINPAKSEIGLVSKQILDRINAATKQTFNVQQWKNSSEVIDWFTGIEGKEKCVFTCFDICEFYPSISEDLLRDALKFAEQSTHISDHEREIIFHSRKSLLFSAGNEWIKNTKTGLFDVTMGSFDGAEVCELIGTYALASLPASRYARNDIGLYRDDGLAVHKNVSGSAAERTKKDLIKHFRSLGLKITIQTNLRTTNFLDLTLDLNSGKYFPYRKPNDMPSYVHRESNHPPSILKNIPAAISRRISDASSDSDVFESAAPAYNDALKASGYSEKLTFLQDRKEDWKATNAPSAQTKRQRSRKVIWFNPPYSKSVKTCIGKRFLKAIDKHFPKGSQLHKIFNRGTVKVSYSCLPNVARIIKAHNNRVLAKGESPDEPKRACNCRKPDQCPLQGNCLTTSVVYKATVKAEGNDNAKCYYGLTEDTFKARYNNHLTSFRHERHSNATELSKHIWSLKRENTAFKIEWSICSRAAPYSSKVGKCQLCLREKMCIIMADRGSLLNTRSELVSTCRHRNKHLLCNFPAKS